MTERRINLDKQPGGDHPAVHIIGRMIKSLIYRDMMKLTAILSEQGIRFRDEDGEILANALLKAADDMEKA